MIKGSLRVSHVERVWIETSCSLPTVRCQSLLASVEFCVLKAAFYYPALESFAVEYSEHGVAEVD